ncbi:MAG: [protein-PII] uridylyltransferase [Burkholderiaceae bacterium]
MTDAVEDRPALLPAPAIRDALLAARERAAAQFERDHKPDTLTRRLSAATDAALRALWAAHDLNGGLVLAAVGGYGRAELFPQSDVDLLIVVPLNIDEAVRERLENFIGACWDIGLPIGQSVRTADECLAEAAGDITIQTSLLDLRWLAGSRSVYRRLHDRLHAQLDPAAFHQAKMLELRQRHVRFEDTPYSLEPNVKESPGGLRDLQVVRWVSMAAGQGERWAEMVQHGLLTAREATAVRRNERTIKRIRAALHLCSNRREDRLVFDLQAQTAQGIGIHGQSARRASEELMQRYYVAAKSVVQFSTLLLKEIETLVQGTSDVPPEPIDAEFQNVQGSLDVRDLGLFERDPAAIFRAILVMERYSALTGITPRTLRAIWRARTRIDARFRRHPANRALFLQILKQPRGITHALRRMNQWSILGRYLPPFRKIVGRMQHDLFHVYTVDQHILMVVRNLRRFTMPEHAHEYPFCSQLMAGYDKPWLLYIVALFHDIAKGRGGDHSQLGRIDVRRFCVDHRLGADETALAEFLVAEHLTMSSVAQKQDLSDPAVIDRFARTVGSEERLTTLYLLTVADIRGTSPKVWNAWKGKLLEDLYHAAKSVLTGESPRTNRRIEAQRTEATRLLNLSAMAEDRYRALWAKLDTAYFLRNDANDIAWHARMLGPQAATAKPIVRARLATIGEGFQVVVYLRDQSDLFARICGYFDRKNLSVLDAQIYTTRDGYALDSFLITDPTQSNSYRDILALVEAELTETLATQAPLTPPVRGRISRRSKYFPIQPQVELRPDERDHRYQLTVTANDRTGLLYSIALVLSQHGINLHTARVTTLGERVEDVFLIDGPSLSNPRQQLQLESDLLAQLKV